MTNTSPSLKELAEHSVDDIERLAKIFTICGISLERYEHVGMHWPHSEYLRAVRNIFDNIPTLTCKLTLDRDRYKAQAEEAENFIKMLANRLANEGLYCPDGGTPWCDKTRNAKSFMPVCRNCWQEWAANLRTT